MKWTKVTLDTLSSAVDVIAGRLVDLGIEGFEIEDSAPVEESETMGRYMDFLPEFGSDDGKASMIFYLEDDEKAAGTLEAFRAMLKELSSEMEIGSGSISLDVTANEDWENNWKAYFRPFMVEDILIRPTWEEDPAGMEGKMTLLIDPGTAFGTGSHETTRLCISRLNHYIQGGEKVLDVGCGSGILSIAALKLGARLAVGTDLDEAAIRASRENAEVNGIDEASFRILLGNVLEDEETRTQVGGDYDIVVANILAPVILMLEKQVADLLKPGGLFISSGIINTKAEEVRSALLANPRLRLLEMTEDGEWVSFTAERIG